jgi:hypothetical protein
LDLDTLARVRVLSLLAAITTCALCATAARAQSPSAASPPVASVQPGKLALMPSASDDSAARELATALDPVVLAQLEAVVGVTAAARVALDLPAMEIALDCVGETPECLRAVVAQTNTDSLLAPSVQTAGNEQVVTLLYYDARGQGELRSVVRRHHGPGVQRAALDAVPAMLRELFGITEATPATPTEPPSSEPAAAEDNAIEPAVEPAQARPFPIAPVIVGAVGVVLIGVGTAFGLAANASEKKYGEYDPTAITQPKDARSSADQAVDAYDRGHTQALISNVTFVAGAAALATGAVWLIVELSSGGTPEDEASPDGVALSPRVAPGELGLSLHGSL